MFSGAQEVGNALAARTCTHRRIEDMRSTVTARCRPPRALHSHHAALARLRSSLKQPAAPASLRGPRSAGFTIVLLY